MKRISWKTVLFFGFLLSILLTGSVPAWAQSVNGTTGNYPFPQNRDNPYGFHSSIYNNADVLTAYNQWYADCVTSTGAGGFLRVQRPNEPGLLVDSTVSEGIGYGMVIAVYMNDENLFDNLWKYEQIHLDGNGLMNWYIDSSGGTQGSNGATDADEDMAWALLMANRQWGGKGTLTNTYLSYATSQINAIYAHELNGNIPDGGDSFTPINPSYFAPAYYREFANATGQTGWTTVASNCYTVINGNLGQGYGNASNGLVSAWCTSAGVSTNTNNPPYDYQYDACRTPFRITEDYLWFGNASALGYATKTSNFFSGVGSVSIVDGYHLDGSPDPQYQTGASASIQSAAFVGPAGVGGMVSRNYQQFMDDAYTDLASAPLTVGGVYYNESWKVMALLMLSDNFLDYALYPLATPTASRTPTPTNTPKPPTFTPTPTVTVTATSTGTLPTLSPTPNATAIYVNAAGPQYVGGGVTWLADQAYTTGGWGYTSGTAYSSAGPIANTTDPTLYMTERAAAGVTYIFTLPNRVYNVTLKWAETFYSGSGQRLFNVALNGVTVVTNLDIYSVAGGKNIAYDRTFAVTVTGGALELDETASVQVATLMAIGIIPYVPPTPTSTATRTATPTNTAVATATFTPTVNTPTFTQTSTRTFTSTSTSTFSTTPTSTPTFSSTWTFTATPSFTNSSTSTPSSTGTPTFSRTYTPTSTSTSSFTVTWTPSFSSTWTYSSTSTFTPAFTMTNTFTLSPSQTATFTHSYTQTFSPTFSPTFTYTYTRTFSPTVTPSFTNTLPAGTNTPTPANTSTFSATYSFTPTFSSTSTYTRTMTATNTATRTVTPTNTATASFTNTSTLTPTWTNSRTSTATSTYTPSPSLTPSWTASFTATLSPTSTPPSAFTATPTMSSSQTGNVPVFPTPVLYPNPVRDFGPVQLELSVINVTDPVRIKIYSTAFRKLNEMTWTPGQAGNVLLALSLVDRFGTPLADGVYYFVIQTPQGRWIKKLLILR